MQWNPQIKPYITSGLKHGTRDVSERWSILRSRDARVHTDPKYTTQATIHLLKYPTIQQLLLWDSPEMWIAGSNGNRQLCPHLKRRAVNVEIGIYLGNRTISAAGIHGPFV